VSTPRTAVLLLAYGTPESPDDVAAYFRHIRGGREPSAEAVARLQQRYELVGGRTPLLAITNDTAHALQETLDQRAPGAYRTYVAMKHWHPFIDDVVPRIAADGIRVRAGIDTFPVDARPGVRVVFSAHSLPGRIRSWNDPYEAQLQDSCAAVAARLSLRDWRFAWQSAGNTGEPWLGPDILEYLETLHGEGARDVLSVPIGFVCEHLEVLFDIDHEATAKAAELGMTLRRTAMPNASPELIAVLDALVSEAERTEPESARAGVA
jgi:ferrochelatase